MGKAYTHNIPPNIPPKIMLAFCQKLITLASCLENVVWFPVSASLKTGFKLHLFRLSKIPLVEDPACGVGRGGVMRGGVRPVRM